MRSMRAVSTLVISVAFANCGGPTVCPPIEGVAGIDMIAPDGSMDPTTLGYAPELEIDFGRMSTLSDGLYCQDHPAGDGAEAASGATVSVHYTGFLPDGSVFDSSRTRAPFSVLLGAGQVIPGWDLGILGMRVGGTRTLVIPPHLAYGALGAGNGVIPPNAVLVFQVELLEVA